MGRMIWYQELFMWIFPYFAERTIFLIQQICNSRPIRFWDVGALVWFARIIEWEFPGFRVRDCLEKLYQAQEILEREGVIEGKIHRFLLAAEKPDFCRKE